MRVSAGDLDTQITVERKSITKDPNYNTDIIAWVPLVALPGSPAIARKFSAQVMDDLPSRSESVRNGLSVGRNQTRIRMRYRNDIDSTMRITVHRDTDVIYQIIAGPALIAGRKNYIEFVCERFTTAGAGG